MLQVAQKVGHGISTALGYLRMGNKTPEGSESISSSGLDDIHPRVLKATEYETDAMLAPFKDRLFTIEP